MPGVWRVPRSVRVSDTSAILGARLAAARDRAGLTQAEVASRLNTRLGLVGDGAQIHQSYIARVEKGNALPSREVLEALAAILPVSYGQLVGAILRDRYFDEDKGELAYPLEKGLITLGELALWESKHPEVWVVAQEFVDHHLRDLFDAVARVLSGGGRFVFFLPRENRAGIRRYQSMLEREAKLDHSVTQNLLHIEIDEQERSLIGSAFVIALRAPGREDGAASDNEPYPNGYSILSAASGEPCLALRMSNFECRRLHDWLWNLMDRKIEEAAE